jgi:hypothetical protein
MNDSNWIVDVDGKEKDDFNNNDNETAVGFDDSVS